MAMERDEDLNVAADELEDTYVQCTTLAVCVKQAAKTSSRGKVGPCKCRAACCGCDFLVQVTN